MIQVVTMERLLTKSKVIECLKLLGDEYTSLNIKVEIHTRNSLKTERKQKQKELKKKEYDNILNPREGAKVPKGVYLPTFYKIKLFPFAILENEFDKLPKTDLQFEDFVRYFTISTLFHEIRHAWQHKEDPEVFEREQIVNDLTKDFDLYQNLPTEKDADSFDREQFTKHISKIRDIFGIKSTVVPKFPKYGEM